jgi:saccharopine dehydrogenase-like NADP-dependent oxidoreductase
MVVTILVFLIFLKKGEGEMKVIALGGAGAMGSLAVRDMAKADVVESLIIADYDLARASELASELGEKCSAVQIDAEDHIKMVEVLKGNDIALGAIGPFYKYEVKQAIACIEAGVNYVSLCDDYDACAAVLELDEDAREAGVLAITGVGWTPGVTSVMARKAADQLDEVDEVATSWASHAADTSGKAVTLHYIHAVTGMIPTYMDGRLTWIPAGSGLEMIRFPQPVGTLNVFHAGHPEPITIPRYINARTVSLKGGLVEGYLVALANFLVKMKLTDTVAKKDILGKIFNTILPYLENVGRPPETGSACRADVTGKKDGRWTHIIYGAAAHMDEITGLPASVAIQMIGEGKVEGSGVMAPEGCLPPDEFLKRLRDGGIRLYQGDEMMTPMEL